MRVDGLLGCIKRQKTGRQSLQGTNCQRRLRRRYIEFELLAREEGQFADPQHDLWVIWGQSQTAFIREETTRISKRRVQGVHNTR